MAKIKVEFTNEKLTECLLTKITGMLWWKKVSTAVAFYKEAWNSHNWWYRPSQYACEYWGEIEAEQDRVKKSRDWTGVAELPKATRVK